LDEKSFPNSDEELLLPFFEKLTSECGLNLVRVPLNLVKGLITIFGNFADRYICSQKNILSPALVRKILVSVPRQKFIELLGPKNYPILNALIEYVCVDYKTKDKPVSLTSDSPFRLMSVQSDLKDLPLFYNIDGELLVSGHEKSIIAPLSELQLQLLLHGGYDRKKIVSLEQVLAQEQTFKSIRYPSTLLCGAFLPYSLRLTKSSG
jgi:hypothetical protein